MLDTFAEQLKKDTGFNMELGKEGIAPTQGKGYLAPGERHMCLSKFDLSIKINEDPKENFVRPAADPLFRSAAKVFGEYCIAVVLTCLGRDGAAGASEVKNAGGLVLIQDPQTATAPSMPSTAIELGLGDEVLPLEKMAAAIVENVRKKSTVLARAN
jgi:two-component system chemotaxis response regulator CheB